jgi:hypothetical protein
MRLLEWRGEHPTGSLVVAARALDRDVTEVEAIYADLWDTTSRASVSWEPLAG